MDLISGITHIHHASFLIKKEGLTIYVDPFEIIDSKNDADFVFCTHTHYDHLSVQDIQRVINKNTILIVTKDGEDKVKHLSVKRIITVKPEMDYETEYLTFKTVKSYNIGKKFHPELNNWVGYIINIKGIKYYFSGDTDLIPEMKTIKADVIFLPVGGTYTMNYKEAVEAANLIKPKIAVPMHFAHLVGNKEDADKFIANLDKDIEGKILL
jgi:L-ascorbate metabolism protein UlaG (beta-lactamase superfamily)